MEPKSLNNLLLPSKYSWLIRSTAAELKAMCIWTDKDDEEAKGAMCHYKEMQLLLYCRRSKLCTLIGEVLTYGVNSAISNSRGGGGV